MDPTDALRNARQTLRRAAAAQLSRKEAIAEEVARLEARLQEARAEAESASAERLESWAETLAELEARLEARRSEAEEAEADLEATLDQLEETGRLRGQLERSQQLGAVRAATSSDPFDPSAETEALENARSAILELEARAEVLAELHEGRAPERPSAELKEARARAELERLKAARRVREAKASADDPSSADAPDPVRAEKPKRTL